MLNVCHKFWIMRQITARWSVNKNFPVEPHLASRIASTSTNFGCAMVECCVYRFLLWIINRTVRGTVTGLNKIVCVCVSEKRTKWRELFTVNVGSLENCGRSSHQERLAKYTAKKKREREKRRNLCQLSVCSIRMMMVAMMGRKKSDKNRISIKKSNDETHTTEANGKDPECWRWCAQRNETLWASMA